MKLTWIVPDTYGFVVDELESLAKRLDGIRVLSGEPVKEAVRNRLPSIEFHSCPELPPWTTRSSRRILRQLVGIHGWKRVIASSWHTRKIAGVCEVLGELEKSAPSTIIHSHFAYPAGLGGWLAPAAAQVLTLRGYDILTTGNYGALWNPFYRKNLLRYYSRSGIVTAGSRFSTLRARQILGSNADIRCVKEGVNSRTFEPCRRHTRPSLGIPEDARVLVSVGELIEVKNPRFLLGVFSALLRLRAKPDLHLILCGEGELREELRRITCELGITDRVHFLGLIPRGELSDILLLSDLFLHPSLSEGFGNVILEAMLHGLIVVSSPVGVAPDVIRHGENGYLAIPGDRVEWLDALNKALEFLPDCNQVADANRQMVVEHYSMDARIDNYIWIYEQGLRNQNTGSLA